MYRKVAGQWNKADIVILSPAWSNFEIGFKREYTVCTVFKNLSYTWRKDMHMGKILHSDMHNPSYIYGNACINSVPLYRPLLYIVQNIFPYKMPLVS